MAKPVLIAHAEGEEEIAELLAKPLQNAGYTVVYRGTLLVGESLVEAASRVLESSRAGCVLRYRKGGRHGLGLHGHQCRSKLPRHTHLRSADGAGEAYLRPLALDGEISRYWQDPAKAVNDLLAALNRHYPLQTDNAIRSEGAFEGYTADTLQTDGAIRSEWAFAGYTADTLHGEDLLGRQKLISDVARWLAVRNLETPLAIGLFGDWGSGKSFFMQRLQEQVDAIAHRAATRESKKLDTAFCSHIVQVSFNAWLYSDSDIWPSLASIVFKAVAGIDPDALGNKAPMEELRRYWAKENPDYAAAAERKWETATREAEAREKVKMLNEEIRKSRDSLVENAKAVGGEFGDEVEQALKAGETLRDIVSVRKRALEAVRRLTGWKKIVLGALALVGVAAAIVAAVNPSAYAVIAAFVGLVASLGGVVAPATNFMRAAIKEDRRREDLKAQRQRASNEWLEAAKAREEAEAQLDLLARRGLLDVYASGQAKLWESRQRLGKVTEIRQAFAKLSTIITETRYANHAQQPEVGRDVPPIDRIVLYIDDLDRCAPKLVVKVLEAIKLLMDLENFVVIVGVDSRWLFRSLEINFQDLLSSDGPASLEPKGGWAATPQNYLEKIFQFSLMLPRMTPEGYSRMVSRLFLSQVRPEGSRTGTTVTEQGAPADSVSAEVGGGQAARLRRNRRPSLGPCPPRAGA